MSKYVIYGIIYEDVDTSAYPHAMAVTDEQAAQIKARTHYVDETGTVQPVPVYSPTIDQAKAEKIAAIDAAYAAELADGIPVVVEGETYRLAGEDNDQTLFNRDLGLLYAQEKASSLVPSESITFIDFYDAPQTVTKGRYFDILAKYGEIIRSLFVQRAAMKYAVRSAVSVEAVAEIPIQFSEAL